MKSISAIIHNAVSNISSAQLQPQLSTSAISTLVQKIPEIDVKELFKRVDQNFEFLVSLLSLFSQDFFETLPVFAK